jgi:alpha-2-macroglobulin
VENNSRDLIKTDYVSTKDGKAIYEMNLGRESWGRKYLRITDPGSGHSVGAIFYTTYKGWWNNSSPDAPGGAEMLTFSTDKKVYNVGEMIQVEMPQTNQGRALVSIESGSKVVNAFWVDAKADNNRFSFKTTPEMTPNVFIHISLIQPHNQTVNDLPIRLYGVQPISVQDPETHLSPQITMPDVLEPEQEVTIKVKEANGKPMTYTLAVVDDGLLDLTRFKTPDAWQSFYAREALGVKTYDMYKFVSGAISGEMAGLLAIGGDEEIRSKDGKKANRFKPVVVFLGPFGLKSGSNTHTFIMPNYIGSVRIMVVAGNQQAYGFTEKTTPVKKPLMVLSTLPRVLGPGESVKLPVTIFAMDDKIKDVKIEVETNDLLKIKSESQKTAHFSEQGDQVINFDLDVAENLGIGKVKVTVSGGGEKAVSEIELNIRTPNPEIKQTADYVIEPGKTLDFNYQSIGIVGTNKGSVELSSIPSLGLDDRLQYLIQYPHGCIEQTTSSVFPQLYLDKLLDLTDSKKQQIENNIRAAIDRLRLFQLPNGGMSYWPGDNDYASEWGTTYAGHFLIEAQKAGYDLPAGFLSAWISYQTDRANEWDEALNRNRFYYSGESQLDQAYRLYTLALAGKPAVGAMNRLRESKKLATAAAWRLASAYCLASREKVAEEMVQNLATRIDPYKTLSGSFGSNLRDQAMILETLSQLKRMVEAKKIIDEISKAMNSKDWYSTQTTSWCLVSVAKALGLSGEEHSMDFELKINNDKTISGKITSALTQYGIDIDKTPRGAVKIINNGKGMLFVKLLLRGIPAVGDPTNTESDLKMAVSYTDLKGIALNPAQIEQGTDFIAQVKITHPGIRGDYQNMSLTQIFPSGWEIRNLRMEEQDAAFEADHADYQDIRDDRVYSYFDIGRNQVRTYRIMLNATYTGRYYLPSVYCEAMYDIGINARLAGQWVEVTGPVK